MNAPLPEAKMPHERKKHWLADEGGAVTIDWVVLGAAMVMLGIGVVATMTDGVTGVAVDLEANLSGATVRELVFD